MPRALAVFVHGVFSSSSTWAQFRNLLAQDDELTTEFDWEFFKYSSPRVRWGLSRKIPDVTEIADVLASTLKNRQAYERIVLIGHSQGGLIIQRYLVRQLAEGNSQDLTRIRRVVLFACPNNGSEFLLSLRKLILWWHPQVRELGFQAAAVSETQRRLLSDIVFATEVDERRCPIPVVAYSGESDSIVSHTSARSVFPHAESVEGNHTTIIRPTSSTHPSYVALRSELLAALREPLPRRRQLAGFGMGAAKDMDVFVEPVAYGPLNPRISEGADDTIRVYVRAGPVDQISDMDIVATSENIYMQMAMTFKPSVSGRLRRAAARRGPSGEIIEDLAANELDKWMREHGRFGLPVEPGTVAATSSGELSRKNIKRIYHAAIGIPVLGTDRFEVNPQTVAAAVHNIFETGRRERRELGLDLRTVLLPLLGAGLGGLSAEISFEWMWNAVRRELEGDPSWEISFCTWSKAETQMVVAGLQRVSA